jgi:cytochrome c peroxidase
VFAAMLSSGESPARETTLSPEALREIAQVEAEIDRIEALALERLAAPLDNQVQQIELLGKLMLYDKELSVNRNEACAFCHMPETGFTGPVSELNRTTGSYPGSVRTRFSERKPQSRLCAAGASSALQPRSGRPRRRQFLGHACDRPSIGQSRRRAGTGAADKPRGNGSTRYRLCGLQGIEAAVSRAVRSGLGATGVRNRMAR